MSKDFKVATLQLSSQTVTATGNTLYVNGQPVGASGSFYPLNSNPSGYATTGNYVDILGTGTISVITGSNVIYISGNGTAVNTGSLTGAFYPLASNPSGYITPSQTGAFGGGGNTGVLTGVFYPLATNPSGYATTGNYVDILGTGNIAVITGSGVLYISGSGLITSFQTGNFVVTSQTGIFITTGQTGQFYPNGQNPSGYILPSQTGQFYPNGQNPSGYILPSQTGAFYSVANPASFIRSGDADAKYALAGSTGSFITTAQTGNYVDSATTLGTGSGLFSSKVGTQLQEKSLLQGSGIQFTGDANTLSINTFLGKQLLTGMQLDTVMTSGNIYYNLVSGTVGPGTWLSIGQSTFRTTSNTPTNVRITMQMWNGNTGAGIYAAAEAVSSTSGQSFSGFAALDLTAIINFTGATNTIGLRAASTLANTYALSAPTNFATGALSGISTYINMVRLL